MTNSPPFRDEDREAMLDAATASLGLPRETARRAEVLAHMKLIGEAAKQVLDFPLADTVEVAPVFKP